MAGTNKFLVFDENVGNIETDEQYAIDSQRIGGVSTGVAPSALHNKLYRQVSIMAAAIGQVIANQNQNASDADLTTLANALTAAFITPFLTKAGGIMTGPLEMMTTTGAAYKNMIALGTYGTISGYAAGGIVAFGMNFYIDNGGNYKYKTTHVSAGARGFVFKYNSTIPYYFDMGQIATTADTIFTPTLNDVWHSGNDGAGSALDAGLLGGKQPSEYAPEIRTYGKVTLNETLAIGEEKTITVPLGGSFNNGMAVVGSIMIFFTTNSLYTKVTGWVGTGTYDGKGGSWARESLGKITDYSSGLDGNGITTWGDRQIEGKEFYINGTNLLITLKSHDSEEDTVTKTIYYEVW